MAVLHATPVVLDRSRQQALIEQHHTLLAGGPV
jgi:hypothetical protein